MRGSPNLLLLLLLVSLSARSDALTDRHSANVRETRRAVRVTAEFPLHPPSRKKKKEKKPCCYKTPVRATGGELREPTTTRVWSRLAPVRPLCAPDACELHKLRTQTPRRRASLVRGVGSGHPAHLIFVKPESKGLEEDEGSLFCDLHQIVRL